MSFWSSARPAKALVAGLAFTLAATTTACGTDDTATAQGETRVFAADNGDITIPADPQRVVATGYAVPALIEADAPLVGISSWQRGEPMMEPEDLATYEKLPRVAGELAAETNYEAIANVQPDVIVVGVPTPVLKDIDLERLEQLAPVVAIGPTVPSAWRELSYKQADAAGALEGFDKMKARYEERVEEVKAQYSDALAGVKFAHVGAYGEIGKGNFHREFNGSWGTNIANDIGADYYGEVKEKAGGSRDVSEYPSIEELPSAFEDADVITYSVDADGSVPEQVKYVMDHELWKNLPAVKAGQTYPVRYTEAATYGQATKAVEALAESLEPLLNR